MEITQSNVLAGIVLLGSIAHLMLLMNGYWTDSLWLSLILVISIPVVIHKFTNNKMRRRRRAMIPKEI